ncbi:MAG: aspartyl/glutamyl-tRNA amidotransferase subunit A [uncultured archaeon A07HR67]|nr:MAG: aspartyl/glutamyl-tRNA amidotransferase subunit A [uncultured archaeon A07HR67]
MGRDLTRVTAAGLARRIRDGDRSPVAVAEAHLERIHSRNDRTNAFVTITDELARETAADAERAVEAGAPLGPLHGVPVAIKDLDDVAGVRTTSGSALFDDRIADSDSPFVERLKRAGAVIVGKTNTPEFGLGTTTTTGSPGRPARRSIRTASRAGRLGAPPRRSASRWCRSRRAPTPAARYAFRPASVGCTG